MFPYVPASVHGELMNLISQVGLIKLSQSESESEDA